MLKKLASFIVLATLPLSGIASSQERSPDAKVTSPLTECGPSTAINELFKEFGRSGKMPAELNSWLNDARIQSVAPYKAFDNVYFVGICWVSAWLINTSQGLVLIDTLYEPYTERLIDNIKKMGFNPADIKLVLLTHGHFDHAGGVSRLKSITNAKFAMTQEGWNEARDDANKSQGKPGAWTMPPAADITIKDGDTLTVGDTNIYAFATPGHTWGTASYVFDVKDENQTYRAITVGGLGLNAIDGPSQVEAYLNSIDRIQSMVSDVKNPITVHLTAHPFSNGLIEAKERLSVRKSGQPHPLVDGSGLIKQLDQLRAGAMERLVSEKEKANK